MPKFSLAPACLLIFSIGTNTLLGQAAPNSVDVGHSELRESLQEVLDPRSLLPPESFQSRHRFSEIAERYWLDRMNDNTKTSESRLVGLESNLDQLRSVIETRPWNLYLILDSVLPIAQLAFDRPLLTLARLVPDIRSLGLPVLFALLCCLVAYLSFWQTALQRDLQRIHPKASPALPISLLYAIFLFAIVFGNLTLACLLSLGLAMIYSHQKSGFIFCAALLAFLMSTSFVWTNLERSLSKAELQEAMIQSRLQVETSPQAIQSLTNLERAILAYWNGNDRQTQHWLSLAEESKEKEIFLSLLSYSPSTATRSLQDFERLREKYPQDHLILFNLVQLNTQQQRLVAADELYQQIPPPVAQRYNRIAQETSRLILPPEPHSPWKSFSQNFVDGVYSLKELSGLQKFFLASHAALPWILFFFFFFLRRSGSGLCRYTGEPTKSSLDALSPLAQLIQQKTDAIDPGERQRYTNLVRSHENLKANRIKSLSWIFPYSMDSQEGGFARAALKSIFFFAILYLSLSGSMRFFLQEHFHLPAVWRLDRSELIWWGLVLVALLYGRAVWRARRSSEV